MITLSASPNVMVAPVVPPVGGIVRRQTRYIEKGSLKFSTHSEYKSLKCSPLSIQSHLSNRRGAMLHSRETRSASAICAAAFNATCVAVQTEPAARQRQITTPITLCQLKEKSPEIDTGGTGFPPRDDGDGGGGGGGWSGGFFLFGFLAFLGFLRDQEKESDYDD